MGVEKRHMNQRKLQTQESYGAIGKPKLSRPKTSNSVAQIRKVKVVRSLNTSASASPERQNETITEMNKQVQIHKRQHKKDKNKLAQIVNMCMKEQNALDRDFSYNLEMLEETHQQELDQIEKDYHTVV